MLSRAKKGDVCSETQCINGASFPTVATSCIILMERSISTVAGPPARPSNIRLQPTQGTLRVEWDGPIWSHHVPVHTYSVELLRSGNPQWLYLDTVRPTSDRLCYYETDQLEPGVYMFRIIAFNDVGSGPPAVSGTVELNA